ncbi:MAG: coproporphyrinogen III oxidase [Sedimentibacter sp.]|uniref:coproporphyrinogen III oxidase n=1 Tax=Sedimentibacter sp. TaxID=1960295 RepID=UPI003158B454
MLTSLLRVVLTRSLYPVVFKSRNENKLKFESLEDMRLYVHIPFCRSLSGFSDCTKELYDRNKASSYKKALLTEIDLVCRNLSAKKHASSLNFGGVSPILMVDDLNDIVEKLKSYFIIDGGIGIELNPEDATQNNLIKLKAAGITMVNMKIESFDENCLNKLGKRVDNLQEKTRLVKSTGFDAVNFELIYAVPGQMDRVLELDIKTAFDCGATQVSLYPFVDLAYEDSKLKQPCEKNKKRIFSSLADYCWKMGAERTSLRTFAKKGTKRYSHSTSDYFLGFGASAATLIKDTLKINTFSLDEYEKRLKYEILPTCLTLYFTKRQRAVYYLFWSAYSLKINIEKFERFIGVSLDKMFGKEFYVAEKLHLVKRSGNFYVLTNKAAYYCHCLEQLYKVKYFDRIRNKLCGEAYPDKIVLW